MRRLKDTRVAILLGGLTVLLALLMVSPWMVKGADHREAPLVDEDPTLDITDVFAFVSPGDPTKVVFAMNVNPFSVPAENPSYSFSPEVLYQFKIDNTGNAREDLVIQARFEGTETARDSRCRTGPGGQFVAVRGPARPKKTGAVNEELGRHAPEVTGCSNTVLGPSPDGVRVFAGLRDDPFVLDVGQVFRILRGSQGVFRAFTSPALGPLPGRPVRADGTSGVDGFGGFNVSTLVVEVPRGMIQGTAARTRTYLHNNTTVGVWGTTSRRHEATRFAKRDAEDEGPFIQLERMGQQLFATVFVPGGEPRDVFNRAIPENDVRDFSDLVPDALTSNDPTGNTIAGRAAVLDAVGVTALPNGAPLLLPPSFTNTDRDLLRKALLPDVLRLDLARPATTLDVGANGLQNGRRAGDDVSDIIFRLARHYGLQNGRRAGDDVSDIIFRLARQLADVKFPDGFLGGIPGSGPLGSRKALIFPDRRIFVVLQGTDFIKPDAQVPDVSQSGNDRPLLLEFPFFAFPHPLPGEAVPAPGTVGFPPPQ